MNQDSGDGQAHVRLDALPWHGIMSVLIQGNISA